MCGAWEGTLTERPYEREIGASPRSTVHPLTVGVEPWDRRDIG